MTTTPAVLIEAAFVDATGITYVSDNCMTAIDKLTATNEGAATAVAKVQLFAADGARVQSLSKAILPGAAWPFPEVVGQLLDVGGKLTVSSPTANAIKPRASGRKFT